MPADLAHRDEPTLAVISAISKEMGQEHFIITDHSVNKWKFKTYLEELRAKNVDEKIAIFMDNLGAHKSEVSKEAMA